MRATAFPAVTTANAQIPDDWACWVVADVHGVRSGLVAALAAAHLTDRSGHWRAPSRTALVVLGDLVGRGADSSGAIGLVQQLQLEAAARGGRVVWVRGNHEQFLIDVIDGDRDSFERWLGKGGRAALISLGAISDGSNRPTVDRVRQSLATQWPRLRSTLAATYPYASWRRILMVHAALPTGGPIALGRSGEVLGDGGQYLFDSRGPGTGVYSGFKGIRGVVVGHYAQESAASFHGGLTLAVDTNAADEDIDGVRGAHMTVVRLPEQGLPTLAQVFAVRTDRAVDRAA